MLVHLLRLFDILMIMLLFIMVMMFGRFVIHYGLVVIMMIVVIHASLHLHTGAVYHVRMHIMRGFRFTCGGLRMTGVEVGISLCCIGRHR